MGKKHKVQINISSFIDSCLLYLPLSSEKLGRRICKNEDFYLLFNLHLLPTAFVQIIRKPPRLRIV